MEGEGGLIAGGRFPFKAQTGGAGEREGGHAFSRMRSSLASYLTDLKSGG